MDADIHILVIGVKCLLGQFDWKVFYNCQMKKVRNEQAKGLSLLEMLDEIDHEEEPERPIQKNQLKMGIEDIMKDTDAFHQEKKKETMARERKKIEPSFNDGLILHFDKKPEEQKGYHHGFEDVEKEWKSQQKKTQQGTNKYESYPFMPAFPKSKETSSKQYQGGRNNQYFKNMSTKPIKGPRITQQEPQFSITFAQEIVFKGVKVSLEFGDYKGFEMKIDDSTALIIPFDDFSNCLDVFLQTQSRTNSNFEGMLLDSLSKKNESTFRTGQIISFPSSKNLPYELFYFVKTATKEGSIDYSAGKLTEFFKNLLPKISKDDIRTIVIAGWTWGKLETEDISNVIFKAIFEGIRQLGNEKVLKKVVMFSRKKDQYKIYSADFRNLSDCYLDAFYK